MSKTGLTRAVNQGSSPVYGHTWSPDESHFVYWGGGLVRARPDGSGGQMLDPLGHNASVEPGTGRIAWVTGSRCVGDDRLLVSAPDGSAPRVVLTTAPDAGDGPMWSPVGGRLLLIEYD